METQNRKRPCETIQTSPLLSDSLKKLYFHLISAFRQLVFPGGSAGKESAYNEGDLGSVPGLGRSPGGGHGNPLYCSCPENPHGEAPGGLVHGVTERQTHLRD